MACGDITSAEGAPDSQLHILVLETMEEFARHQQRIFFQLTIHTNLKTKFMLQKEIT